MSGRVRPEPWEPLPPLPRGSKRQEQQREELQDVLIDEEPSIWIWVSSAVIQRRFCSLLVLRASAACTAGLNHLHHNYSCISDAARAAVHLC